jgi:hypothetical protein
LIALLMPFFCQADEDVRQSVIRILEMRNEPLSRDLLRDLLSDEDSNIRQAALRILQKQSPQTLSDLASQALAVLDGQTMGQVFPTLVQMHVADTIGDLGITSTMLLEKLTELLDLAPLAGTHKSGSGSWEHSSEHPRCCSSVLAQASPRSRSKHACDERCRRRCSGRNPLIRDRY